MSDPRVTSPMTERREALGPIWVRLWPAPSTIESWRPIVDQHLTVRAALDKTRIAPLQTSALDRRDP